MLPRTRTCSPLTRRKLTMACLPCTQPPPRTHLLSYRQWANVASALRHHCERLANTATQLPHDTRTPSKPRAVAPTSIGCVTAALCGNDWQSPGTSACGSHFCLKPKASPNQLPARRRPHHLYMRKACSSTAFTWEGCSPSKPQSPKLDRYQEGMGRMRLRLRGARAANASSTAPAAPAARPIDAPSMPSPDPKPTPSPAEPKRAMPRPTLPNTVPGGGPHAPPARCREPSSEPSAGDPEGPRSSAMVDATRSDSSMSPPPSSSPGVGSAFFFFRLRFGFSFSFLSACSRPPSGESAQHARRPRPAALLAAPELPNNSLALHARCLAGATASPPLAPMWSGKWLQQPMTRGM